MIKVAIFLSVSQGFASKLYDKINANQTVSHCIPSRLKSEFSLRQPRRERERYIYICVCVCVLCVYVCVRTFQVVVSFQFTYVMHLQNYYFPGIN